MTLTELEEANTTPPPPPSLRHPTSASPSPPLLCHAVSHSPTARPLPQAMRERERECVTMRTQCDAEKEALVKQFEQRVAGLRLEKDQARAWW